MSTKKKKKTQIVFDIRRIKSEFTGLRWFLFDVFTVFFFIIVVSNLND